MGFADDIATFNVKVRARDRRVFRSAALMAYNSIKVGSSITGAPGQPVDTGYLRNSWSIEFTGEDEALIATNVVYAPYIEDGMNSRGPFTLRSAVGGFHSLKQTVAGFQAIVDVATQGVADE